LQKQVVLENRNWHSEKGLIEWALDSNRIYNHLIRHQKVEMHPEPSWLPDISQNSAIQASTKYRADFEVLEGTLPRLAFNDIVNDCGSDLEIEADIKGVIGQSNPNFNIGDVSNALSVIVNVWVEAADCPGRNFVNNLVVNNGSQSITTVGEDVTQASAGSVGERIYRATIFNPTSSMLTFSGLAPCTASSISVQKVMQSDGSASSALIINQEFHNNTESYIVPIGTADIARDIRIEVPIHEKSDDGRIARIEVSGNGVPLQSAQITMQNRGAEAGLLSIDLTDVPPGTTSLNVRIVSPDNNGDSFGVDIISTRTLTSCECAAPSLEDDTFEICPGENREFNVLANDGVILRPLVTIVNNHRSNGYC